MAALTMPSRTIDRAGASIVDHLDPRPVGRAPPHEQGRALVPASLQWVFDAPTVA